MNKLTPVQSVGGLLFKRDDLYEPFGPGEVNGGKMRQCMMLLDSVKDEITGVISCCSIHSPQAPITAAAALAFGKRCKILYGGTSRAKLLESPMPRLCLKYGATVLLATRSGRHNVLYAKAKELKGPEDFIVQYGINLSGHSDVLLGAVAAQVENIPDEIENLVMTCGSGITASGVMIGLNRYGKKVRNVHLVATGARPAREHTPNAQRARGRQGFYLPRFVSYRRICIREAGDGCLGWHHAPPKLRSEDNAVVRKKRPRPWKHAVLDCGSSAPEHPAAGRP